MYGRAKYAHSHSNMYYVEMHRQPAILTRSEWVSGFTVQRSVCHEWQKSHMHQTVPNLQHKTTTEDFTLIQTYKVGTPPRWPDHCPKTRSALHVHTVFIVAITAVPRRNRTPCRLNNNLRPAATRSGTYLMRGNSTCRQRAKEPLKRHRHTACVCRRTHI